MAKLKFLLILLILSFNLSAKDCHREAPHPTLLDSVFIQIVKMRLEHPTIVMSQVIIESAHLESKLFEQNNNMFGMRQSGQRATTSLRMLGGYKYYDNWQQSLMDYALLQMAYYRGLTREEYFDQLGQRYASALNYVKVLKEVEKNLCNYLTEHSLVL